jgi:hypothetical protein
MKESDKKLEDVVAEEDEKPEPSKRKIAAVDTAGNITYSLIVGSIIDYSTGLDIVGILASRGYATAMNSVTGAFYNWWREQAFEVTKTKDTGGLYQGIQDLYRRIIKREKKKSIKSILYDMFRSTIVELLAFNTLQVPIYATAVAIGSLVSEGRIDWEKVQDGATYLAEISPLIAPTMGLYMDGFRRMFGVKSAAEGAYKSKENK